MLRLGFSNGTAAAPPSSWLRAMARGVLGLMFGLLIAETALADDDDNAIPALAYDWSIDGVDDETLKGLLTASARLESLKGTPPFSLAALDRRAAQDKDQFDIVLRSEGYYAAQVFYTIESSDTPAEVNFSIDPGPRYRLGAYRITYLDGPRPDLPQALEDLGIDSDRPARAPEIVDFEVALTERLAEIGHPYADIADRRVVVSHGDRALNVTVTVRAGQKIDFGQLTVVGLENVDEGYIRRLVPWTEGNPFDQSKVDSYRQTLLSSALFSTVAIETPDSPANGGAVPVTLKVEESKHRTVGVGASYSSSEGFGLTTRWEHRNIFGDGERLRVRAEAAQIRQSLGVDLRKPNFRRLKQSLVLAAEAKREDNDTYEENLLALRAGIERPFRKRWIVSYGTALELSEITENAAKDTFVLVSTPLGATRDTTDDLLDPKRGLRTTLRVTPYVSLAGGADLFLAVEAATSAYKSLFEERVTLAGRVRVGTIAGAATTDLPASKRFYAGGAGSVRGYDYQKIGALDDQNDPIGGRSVIEAAAEARIRITDTIGIAPFVDVGTVADGLVPDFSERLQWAAGLGAIYQSPVGPIRLDIAVPINGRDVDDSFEIYISIGQSF